MRSSGEEKRFVGYHEGEISVIDADIFLVFKVSYVPW